MNIEKMREGFESENSHRAWFVSGGRIDSGPEGFVYDDFTTDMCWTCWVGSRAAIEVELPNGGSLAQRMYGPDAGGLPLLERHFVVEAIESLGLKVKP